MKRTSLRINRAKAGLLVIDIQERLLPAIFEHERVLENSLKLIRGAQILGVPVLATEQYRKGLGATVPQIAQLLGAPASSPAGVASTRAAGEGAGAPSVLQKLTFSACGAAGWTEAIESRGLSDVILCGIEAHVCVAQTCLDLLDAGNRVFVAADAISSRTASNHRLALERMRDAGAVIVPTEMILFELLECAGTDEFKRMLAVVK